MRLIRRLITRRISLAVLNDVASSIRKISACCQCPFDRNNFCTHPTDRRINLNGVNTLLTVHKDCPLIGKPLLLQIRPLGDYEP